MPRDLTAILNRVDLNPLGRLMHGQRELFHSNLLAWFFDALPAAADRAFRPLSEPGNGSERRVERERKNLDLVMHWPDRAPLVIENKVFSLPGRGQLEEYEQTTSTWHPSPTHILLSASAPGFTLPNWEHVGYNALAETIRASLPNESSYEVETMRRFADLAECLHELLLSVEVHSDAEEVWIPDSELAAATSNQMRAALRKARAHRVAQAITKALDGLGNPSTAGMSNSIPLVESFRSFTISGLDLSLGWQLQGPQFRRIAIYHDPHLKGRTDKLRELREAESALHPEFFTFPPNLPQEHAGRKNFNNFAPDSIYQYVKVPNLAIRELTESVKVIHRDFEQLDKKSRTTEGGRIKG